ncbi:MAG: hypothetical protein IKO01_07020 [Kiritimatiellae bacterium]|nr:hypothetical protein [Kiritimatiellia bacterium]
MPPTRNRLAAMLHAALLASSFFLLPSAVAPAAAEVIPIIITNIVVQKIGPEAELEPLEEGLLYWRPADATTDAGLYYADGETPGGVAVCVGKADYHTLTNDLACNGHALKLNAHYSLRAEGDSCLLRYGTNIVLRVDGNREAGSTNSLIKATILSADNDGLTIQANALASDGATIEVTTDLMAVESWTTATNAVVTDTTDVSTTWRITYLDEPYQFYRVFAGASTPHGTGITAERPFTASQGLAIPEGQGLTLGPDTWTNLPDMSIYASNSAVAAVRADLASLSWRTTTAEGAIDANAAGIAAVQGAVATNAGNIATNSTRLSVIEADYVHSSALADLATTASVEAVEERVGEVEWMLEEYWCKWTGASLSNTQPNWIPTNWPARTVHCFVVLSAAGTTNIIGFPDWSPQEPRTLDLHWYKAAAGAGILQTADGTSIISTTGTSASFYECLISFVPDVGWVFVRSTVTQPVILSGNSRVYIGGSHLPEDGTFAPVIESPSLLSTPSLQSLRPSLSSSAPLALGADLDAPDALDEDFPEDTPDDPDPGDDFADPDADPDAEADALPTLDEEA